MIAVREVGVHREPTAEAERVTSLAMGEEVLVVEQRDEWTRVLAPDQPTRLDPAGYPGWVPFVEPRPGDLYFFGRYDEAVSHVAFVTETGLLHATEGVGVVEQPMRETRRATLLGAGRLPR